METVIHIEISQVADIPTYEVEIRLAAEIYQISLERTIRNIVLEYRVRHRLTPI